MHSELFSGSKELRETFQICWVSGYSGFIRLGSKSLNSGNQKMFVFFLSLNIPQLLFSESLLNGDRNHQNKIFILQILDIFPCLFLKLLNWSGRANLFMTGWKNLKSYLIWKWNMKISSSNPQDKSEKYTLHKIKLRKIYMKSA